MSKRYKKLLILISVFALVFSFVTYQPKKVDAFASTAVKFVAQKFLQATTKTAVDKSISKMLVDEVLDEVKKEYAMKAGFKLIENGGQKVLMKDSYSSADINLLKNEVDKVIDKQVYGNTPKFAKYIDWFIGVGAVIQFGQLLHAAITSDVTSYIMELINEAMINLGWITPAPKIVDGKDPKPDPVTFPQTTEENVEVIEDVSAFRQFVTRNSPINQELKLSAPQVPLTNYVMSAEMTSEKIPTGSVVPNDSIMGYFNGVFLHSSDGSLKYYNEASPFNLTTLFEQKRINVYTSALGRHVTIKYGSTVLYDGMFMNHPTYIDLPSSFDARNYNKVVYQPLGIDSLTGKPITRYFLISTLGLQDTLSYVATKDTTLNTSAKVTEVTVNMRIPYDSRENANTFRVGIFNSLDLAWSADALPRPNVDPKYFDTPILDPSTQKIALPQKSVLPPDYSYDPEEQVIKSPTGEPVTDVTTIPEFTPDPILKPSPDGTVIVDDVPTDIPVPPDGITPDEPTDPPGGVEGGTPSEIEWEKLKAIPALFTMKFPFSLPWDAKRFMEGVFGDIPEAGEFAVDIDELMGINFDLHIRLPDYFDNLFDFSRTATVILFDLGLIYGLYRLLGGAS